MLKGLQTNIFSERNSTAGVGCSKAHMLSTGTENAARRLISTMPVPSIEDELDDFSSSSEAENRPALPRPVPRQRLRRNDEAKDAAKAQTGDLLTAMAALGLKSDTDHPIDGSRSAAGGEGFRAPSDGHDDPDSDSDDERFSFYERLAPSMGTKTASSAGPLPPDAGALVLGEQHQYVLPAPVAQKLYPHQVQGVKWLWSLFAMQRGGILGDDMGLGKTMQCSAFLAGLFGSQLIRRAIIIAPKTLLPHWIKELEVCGLRSLTHEFFGSSESERSAALRCVVNSRGIIVTTYGMIQYNSELLSRPVYNRADDFTWDVMFLDEGHKLKNPKMKLVEHVSKLPVRIRVIISGTPIQNNLMELHSLFHITTTGLLGDARTFRKNYENPITKGLDKEATARERQTGAAIAAELRNRLEPFLLRREKKDVLTDNKSDRSSGVQGDTTSEDGPSTSGSATAGGPQIGQRARGLPRKNDLVVWLQLTPLQRKIYTAFLHTDSVRQVLNEKASPLAAITVLKKICDHPALLSQRAASSVISGAYRWAKRARRRDTSDLTFSSDEDSIDDSSEDGSSDGVASDNSKPSHQGGVADAESPTIGDGAGLYTELARQLEQRGAEASCKTVFILSLLERLHALGHRTLIFSQSKVMLNILEASVQIMKLQYCRIDGDVASAEERQMYVQRFQSSNIPVFLLTSQVGGLGLTLTAADRVIIVDPAWNPSLDDQSVDRAYRMGQTRDVVVYRLITCGTVEEKIYRRQVFKGGLSKTGTEEGIQFRYFTQTELRDLFSVTTEGLQQSVTQSQLHEMHVHQRDASDEVHKHLKEVMRMEGVAGIHDHNLLFTQRPDEPVPSIQEGQEILSQMTGSGPVGIDTLTAMVGSSLTLSGRPQDTKQQAEMKQLRNEIAQYTNTCRNYEMLISSGKADRMPDGGIKMRASLREMQAKLKMQVARLAMLECLSEGAETADPVTGVNLDVAQPSGPPATTLQGSVGATATQPTSSNFQTEPKVADKAGVRKFGFGLASRSAVGHKGTDGGSTSNHTLPPSAGSLGELRFNARDKRSDELSSSRGNLCGGSSNATPVNPIARDTRGAKPAASNDKATGELGAEGPKRVGGLPAAIALNDDEGSFITAHSTGIADTDDVSSNVIDLTDTP
ncbi:hypothetical protein VaNZ11_013570 [Volvox africanus]|uniref:Uncharacterized protein n=1 Tax=Volvox africanus TaxID=51714 RepID=A0ABQ5SGX6_9CHLO|nr:hypothetical protein VaNZ11_013570 [Volvox africanus]